LCTIVVSDIEHPSVGEQKPFRQPSAAGLPMFASPIDATDIAHLFIARDNGAELRCGLKSSDIHRRAFEHT
jgi:hypothetical protein